MNIIFQNDGKKISYDNEKHRALIDVTNGRKSPTSIAMRCIPKKEERSAWDSIVNFVLRNFTWSWIKVNNGSDSTQIININSLKKHLNMKSEEIKSLNKKGLLYLNICERSGTVMEDDTRG